MMLVTEPQYVCGADTGCSSDGNAVRRHCQSLTASRVKPRKKA